jgi:hypothetical protein
MFVFNTKLLHINWEEPLSLILTHPKTAAVAAATAAAAAEAPRGQGTTTRWVKAAAQSGGIIGGQSPDHTIEHIYDQNVIQWAS